MRLFRYLGLNRSAAIYRGIKCTQCQVSRRQISLISNSQYTKFRHQFQQYTGGSIDLVKDVDTKLATIIINNPEKKNALSGKMMVDLDDAVRELECWDVGRGVILTGAGGAFCSGGDLDTVKKIADPVNGAIMCDFMQSLTLRLLSLPMISIAAIEGPALGGGAELTTACDFRIMKDSPKSRIGFVQVKLGVAPGWGGATKLVGILGRTKALYLLSSGNLLHANDAFNIGLVDKVCPEESDIAEEAKKWLIENIAPNQESVDVVKTMVTIAANLGLSASMAAERELFCKVWGGESHTESLQQQVKHRPDE